MAAKVNAATLVNTVKYRTDRASLKRVRADMRNLQKQFSKTSGAGTPAASREIVRSARKQAEQRVDASVKAMDKVAKERAKQNAKNFQNRMDELFGISKQGKSARDSMRVFQAQATAQSDIVKRQTQQMNGFEKRRVDFQDKLEKRRKTILDQRAKQQKIDRTAALQFNKSAFEVGRLNLANSELMKYTRNMERLSKQYRQGYLNLAEYREQSRQLLRTTRDQSRELRTLGQRLRDIRKGGDGGLGLGGKGIGLALGGAVGLGYLATNAARNALQGSVERVRGLQRVNSMGIATDEVQALQVNALRETGFDLSFEKISDISKDVQDKIGQLSLGEWKQKKDGTWDFGGGGELGDWVKIMTQRGGYSREGSIQALQSVRGPIEMAVLLENLRKSAKLTDSEFTALAEAINDFSYVAKGVGENGKNLLSVQEELISQGLIMTKQQQDSLSDLSKLALAARTTGQALQNNFSAAFSDSFGLSAKELQDELAKLVPAMRHFGDAFGGLLRLVLKFSTAFWDDYSSEETTAGGNLRKDSWLGRGWDILTGEENTTARSRYQLNPMYTNPNMPGWNPYGIGQQMQAPIQINPTPLNIQVVPDPELGRVFDARALTTFNEGINNLTFDINQSTMSQ